jgi:hypothetical protein
MKKDKPTLIFIIIMCIIFIPLASYGTYLYIVNNKVSNTKNNNFYYNGQLNFYENNLLLGTYKCENKDPNLCGYITNYNDSLETNIDTFKEGTKNNLGIIDGKFAFIKDGSNNYIYSITTNKVISNIDGIKFYNTDIDNNIILIKINGKWGLMNLNSMSLTLNATYDDLFLIDNHQNKLNADYLIAYANNNYEVIDNKGNVLSKTSSDPIYNFSGNGKLLTVKNNTTNLYSLYSFDGQELLLGINKKLITFSNNYYAIIDNINTLYIYKNNNYVSILTDKNISYDSIYLEESTNLLSIYINKTLYKTIAIS